MTLANTTFSGNSANGGDGGAIYDTSTGGLTITNGTFSGNTATGGDGGAIYDTSTGGLEFNGGSVTNNSVSPGGNGGGIFDSSSGGIHITNVVFTGNTSTGGNGGAIYDSSSVGTGPVSNNCIVGNTATLSGGGIFRSGAPALNAIDNWWGAATGPSQAGPGTGDAVTSNVTFAPFLTSPADVCSPHHDHHASGGDDDDTALRRLRGHGRRTDVRVDSLPPRRAPRARGRRVRPRRIPAEAREEPGEGTVPRRRRADVL